MVFDHLAHGAVAIGKGEVFRRKSGQRPLLIQLPRDGDVLLLVEFRDDVAMSRGKLVSVCRPSWFVTIASSNYNDGHTLADSILRHQVDDREAHGRHRCFTDRARDGARW